MTGLACQMVRCAEQGLDHLALDAVQHIRQRRDRGGAFLRFLQCCGQAGGRAGGARQQQIAGAHRFEIGAEIAQRLAQLLQTRLLAPPCFDPATCKLAAEPDRGLGDVRGPASAQK